MIRRPTYSTLFPYTTLFRSDRKSIFFFNNPAPTEIFTLSLHDALPIRSEEHTSELQSLRHLVCRLLLEKKKKAIFSAYFPTTKHSLSSTLGPRECNSSHRTIPSCCAL